MNSRTRLAVALVKAMLVAIAGLVVIMDAQSVEVKQIEEPMSQPQRVMANTKCEAVPEGQFPTGAIVQNMNDGARYTAVKDEVSMAFEFAVGEREEIPFRLFKLCK